MRAPKRQQAAEPPRMHVRLTAPPPEHDRRASARPRPRRRKSPRRHRRRPAPPDDPARPASPVPERRAPLRFVWTMDADERFTLAATRLRRRDGTAHRASDRQAVARDRGGARRSIRKAASPTRSRRATPGAASRIAWPVDDDRRDRDGRIVRPADLRSRPQFPRLSRLRRLPRGRACAARRRRRGADGAGRTEPRRSDRPKRRHPSRARCSPSCRPPRTSCRSAAPRPPRSARR